MKSLKSPFILITFFLFNVSCSLDNSDELNLTNRIFDYNINMLICYGQSNSSGPEATNNDADFRNTLAFQGGCNESMSYVDINNPTSLLNFYGNQFVDLNSLEREDWPPVSSAALTWMNLLEQENNIFISDTENQFLLSTPGSRGSDIDALSKNTEYYKRLIYSVEKARDFSQKENKSFGVPCVFWVQGESDMIYSEDRYYEKLKVLLNNLNADILNITKQKRDVIFIISQTSTVIGNKRSFSDGTSQVFQDSGPSFAQLKLAKEKDNVYMGGAMYQYEYEDFWHPRDLAVVGIQSGIAAKRIFNDKQPLAIFHPISHSVTKNESNWKLKVKFSVPVSPMKFDISNDKYHNLNGKQENFGFILKNFNGKNIIYKEPYIIDDDTLVIECSENPTNATLSYALNGHFGGGNLCDSQNIIIKNKNIDYIIDNFCPSFRNYIIK